MGHEHLVSFGPVLPASFSGEKSARVIHRSKNSAVSGPIQEFPPETELRRRKPQRVRKRFARRALGWSRVG
jgi:hypothetical protein